MSPRRRTGPPAPPPRDPRAALEAALALRAPLLADPTTDVVRLVHGAADGLPGLVVERLGPVLIAQLHAGHALLDDPHLRDLCATLAARIGATGVYRKLYPKDRGTCSAELTRLHTDPQPWLGAAAPAEFLVREAGVQFLVRPYDGYATGLFLDHRAGRAYLRAAAAGRRVLNVFAYTCGHTVAAALGGAAQTLSIDASRKSLEWGKRNLAANGVTLAAHRFIHGDVFEYFRRARRQGHRFDWVVLDPPTLGRAKDARRVFALTADLPRLVREALELLAPAGFLQLSVNHRGTTLARLEQTVRAAAGALQRGATVVERLALPLDFRGDPDYAKSIVVRID